MSGQEPEKHLVLGTAGHVDHGKTTLIKALTGINPDRLKEEQERGLTIDLGFAWIKLPSGALVGIVDVPGHERFLKNMLAGASGIDIALLVVAADESVMPQTREHVEILELLETPRGVVALTKCDMVESDWLDVVEEDLRDFLSGKFLRDARIVRVSGTTGEGIPDLVAELDRLAGEARQRSVEGPFRLPVDRVFTISGFGTVVTGTLVSGTLRVGDAVTVLPEKLESRARRLQVHGKKEDTVYAGSRVAVNLAGVEVRDLGRGSVIVPPGYPRASSALDASVTVLPNSPRALTNRARVRIHLWTAEVIGRVTVLGASDIAPGSKGMARFRLESPVVAARGDRFVLRFYSPMVVLGGGIALDPSPARHKSREQGVVERLQRALEGDPADIVLDTLAASEGGLIRPQIARKTGLTEDQVKAAMEGLVRERRVIEHTGRFLAATTFEGVSARIRSTLAAYHAANPMRAGAPKEEIRAQLSARMDQKSFQAILALMAERGEVAVSEAAIRLPEHAPTLSTRQQVLAERIEAMYRDAGANPPLVGDLERQCGADAREMVTLQVNEGKLVRITPDLLFHSEAMERIELSLMDYLKQHGQITVAQFRDLIDSSRKYCVPLLEYLDDKQVTRRVGDQRVPARRQ